MKGIILSEFVEYLEQELGVVTFDASLHSADQFETDNGEAVRSTAEA